MLVNIRRRKTVCKNKPHKWAALLRKTELATPDGTGEVLTHRICLRCGRKERAQLYDARS